ncbi:hypothetical protein LJ707_10400 [Mucilaginibacter sp. UR6-1]|uniref:hypothetical protein n=1 Tax=Mucilaginibacter sp. UR6-1 TaxID=1435643 RepID=UPI001E4E66F0|nr:hypothetical protein [Mucilaginibacter sp. UR6-1]MCC8409343.1 hypothetical protein [Mucilaginibacter sp. UR6-1]
MTTMVGDLRKAGADIIKTSVSNPNHATMTGPHPETASKLLNPVIKNPNKNDTITDQELDEIEMRWNLSQKRRWKFAPKGSLD